MSKPREFELDIRRGTFRCLDGTYVMDDTLIKVIEHSAYLALDPSVARLKRALSADNLTVHVLRLEDENTRLKCDLEYQTNNKNGWQNKCTELSNECDRLREALEYYAHSKLDYDPEIARQALKGEK